MENVRRGDASLSDNSTDSGRRRLLRSMALSPFALLALPGCAGRPADAFATAGFDATGRLRRQYVDGRFGQIHLYKIEPPLGSERRKHALMCFHPTAVSGDYYRDFMIEMGRDRTVMAMDTPGYGKSDRPAEPQPMQALAGAAADALDALGYGKAGRGPVDVLGYHTGVYIATELAILRPDLVRRLVLPGIPYYVGEPRAEMYSELVGPEPVDESGAGIMEIWKFWVQDRDPAVSVERGAEHFSDYLQSGPHSWWAYHAVFTYAAEERLPLVAQPVLVPNTHGSLQQNTREAAKLFPDVQLIELPQLHHGIFDVGVDILSRVSRSFLD